MSEVGWHGADGGGALAGSSTINGTSCMLGSFPIKYSARFVTSSRAAGAVSVAVTALAEEVIQMMWLTRRKPLVAVAAIEKYIDALEREEAMAEAKRQAARCTQREGFFRSSSAHRGRDLVERGECSVMRDKSATRTDVAHQSSSASVAGPL